mgnify:CR=1 FL=1
MLHQFYINYLSIDYTKNPNAKHPHLQFSRAFLQEKRSNEGMCRRIKDMPCGFGADGDPYLDAQDFADNLNAASAQLRTELIELNTKNQAQIRVNFSIFPGTEVGSRSIVYQLKHEKGAWKVDDIVYGNGESARALMRQEIEQLKRVRP